MTINNRELLYLPVLRLNELSDSYVTMQSDMLSGENMFGVAVNEATRVLKLPQAGADQKGIMDGVFPKNSVSYIRVDQGLVNTVQNVGQLPHSLVDSAFLIEIDDRLGQIVSFHGPESAGNTVVPEPSFVDDDQIATYFLSDKHVGDFVTPLAGGANQEGQTPITGRKGTSLKFKIKSNVDLADSNVLFDKIGKTVSMDTNPTSYKAIDSVVRVVGAVTGHRLDIPVRFFKLA